MHNTHLFKTAKILLFAGTDACRIVLTLNDDVHNPLFQWSFLQYESRSYGGWFDTASGGHSDKKQADQLSEMIHSEKNNHTRTVKFELKTLPFSPYFFKKAMSKTIVSAH